MICQLKDTSFSELSHKTHKMLKHISLSQLSQKSLTHIIRDGEFMGAGLWTGIQTCIGEQWDKKGNLTFKKRKK